MQVENIVIAVSIIVLMIGVLWMIRLLVILAEGYNNPTAKRILSVMDMYFSITILTDLLTDFVKSMINGECIRSAIYLFLLILFIPICLLGPLGTIIGGERLSKRIREKMGEYRGYSN